jgi:hypothetical protein
MALEVLSSLKLGPAYSASCTDSGCPKTDSILPLLCL